MTKRTKKTDGKVQTELDYEVLSEWLSQSRPCAMGAILKAQGSSPRKEGAKMLILKISLFWEVLEVVWQKVRLLKKDVK